MDKDDISEFQRGWLEHPHTRHLRKQASDGLEAAFHNLKVACLNSIDPRVKGMYHEYLGRLAQSEIFGDGDFR